jgi:hypothetical protein
MPRTVGDIAKQGLTELPMTLADELAGIIRGSAKTTLGAPGDINEIARDYVVPVLPYRFRQILEGLQNAPAPFPTSEELEKKFPPVLPKGADRSRKIAADIGEGAGELIPVDPFALVGMAGRTAKRGLKAADTIFSNAPSAGGRKSQRGIIKAPGGNWLNNHVLEKELKQLQMSNQASYGDPIKTMNDLRERYTPEVLETLPLSQRNQVAASYDRLQKNIAVNKWIDSNLGNYVKKQMGTEGDPVRALAERGVTHKYFGDEYTGNAGASTVIRREKAGFPGEGVGVSPEARQWEHASDIALRDRPASNFLNNDLLGNAELRSNNQWLNKVDPNTNVNYLSYGATDELGFDKLVDTLYSDMEAGNIRPEQLNKLTVPDAVQRTFNANEAARKAKEAAEAAAVRANLSLNPYKEYPSGHKWITLPDPTESDEAMKSVRDIGCQGGWCTQREAEAAHYGNPEEGNALHVLLDPSGKPHVQIHVESIPQNEIFLGKGLPQDIYHQLNEQAKDWTIQRSNELGRDINDVYHSIDRHNKFKELENQFRTDNPQYQYPQSITQIKPFSNTWNSQMVADATKKNPNYRKEIEPFLQDFVKSGNWARVDDLANTGLLKLSDIFNPVQAVAAKELAENFPKYMTPAEAQALKDKFAETYQVKKTSEEPPMPDLITGFKRGGKVNLEDQYRLNKLNGTISGTQHRM